MPCDPRLKEGEATQDQDALRQARVNCQMTTGRPAGSAGWYNVEVTRSSHGVEEVRGAHREAGTCPTCAKWHTGQPEEGKRFSSHNLSRGRF